METSSEFYARFYDFGFAGDHDGMVVMQDDSGFDLVLEEGRPEPQGFHFGFRVEDHGEVQRLREALSAGGYEPFDEMEDFMVSFKVRDPDGYAVEVYCY